LKDALTCGGELISPIINRNIIILTTSRNPINGVKELKPPPPIINIAAPIVYVPIELTPAHTAYWQEGVGLGGDIKWKFNCMCGDTCSSYENFRYHPTGRMYECSKCSVWSHVSCVLGDQVTSDDLEEMTVSQVYSRFLSILDLNLI
jgi:hypothetical protein